MQGKWHEQSSTLVRLLRAPVFTGFIVVGMMVSREIFFSVAAASIDGKMATATISRCAEASVPRDFMGLSIEWRYAQEVMGSTKTHSDPIFQQLLKNLTDENERGHSERRSLVLRIGGGSTDQLSLNPASPNRETIQPFIDLYHALGTKFILGVNARSDDLDILKAQASFYSAQMPAGSLLGLEVGNEPELYGITAATWYPRLAKWIKTMKSVSVNVVPIVNCAFSDCKSPATGFLGDLNTVLRSTYGKISMFTSHFYTGSDERPADWLLEPRADSGPKAVFGAMKSAHDLGLLFRVDEMNSLAKGGLAGVSDTFQSALWVLAELFGMAAEGVDGVNIQGFWKPGMDHYSPATISALINGSTASYKLQEVCPIYYGLVLFQQATRAGAKIFPVVLDTHAHLYGWATIDPSGVERLILDNMDESSSGNVTVSVPEFLFATVSYLRAPSYNSRTGITLAGQTFDGTPNGEILGKKHIATIQSSSGTFTIYMPAVAAAVVTFHH